MTLRLVGLVGCFVLLASLGNLRAENSGGGPGDAVPAVAFFQPSDFSSPALSPDGRFIAFIGRGDDHACLFLLDRNSGRVQGLFRPGEGQVEHFWWKGSGRILLAGSAPGAFNTYYVQELGSGKPGEIPALRGVPTSWINPLPGDADHVVVAPDDYGGRVTRIDLRTGREQLVERLTGSDNACVTSSEGELRAYTRRANRDWKIAWRASAAAPWHTREGKGRDLPFRPFMMDADDRHLLVFAYDQGDTVVLMRLDPESDERTTIVQYPGRDVSRVLHNQDRSSPPVAFAFGSGEGGMQILDEAAKPFLAGLAQALPGASFRWIGSSADRSLRIVYSWSARDPGRYLLYDSGSHALTPLGQSHRSLPPAAMGEVRRFTYSTRDGVTESGYVVLPPGPRTGPAPLLVIHMDYVGQPADDGSAFYPLAQFFATRGFAVARFAVRGSYGFGRAFEKAGDFQFGGRIVQDLEDGIDSLARTQPVDAKRAGIIGWGVGGLIALRTASASPVFRAVAVVGSWATFDADAVALLTSADLPLDQLREQLGGADNVNRIADQLNPQNFLPSLSAPVFIAYKSWYESTSEEAGRLRRAFDHHKRRYEWFKLDTHFEKRSDAEYQAELYTKIADFLQRSL